MDLSLPYAWIRPPRKKRAYDMYHTRHAFPPIEEGRTEADPTGVDVDDAETKRKIGAFNALVHKHRVCPAQTIPNDARRAKLAALQKEAAESLGVDDVGRFMKHTVWPFCKNGGDLSLVGFHYEPNFLPESVEHDALAGAVFPEGYVWEDNDPKHRQNREVCTHGVTLLDKEQLNPAECQPLPFPGLVQHRVVPALRRALERLALPADMDFLYANRYRQAKGGYIRFHHDQLTKMGPVVAGVSLGATAHMSYVRTCTPDTKLPGTDGAVEVELEAGSLYVMTVKSAESSFAPGHFWSSSDSSYISKMFEQPEASQVPIVVFVWGGSSCAHVGASVGEPGATEGRAVGAGLGALVGAADGMDVGAGLGCVDGVADGSQPPQGHE
jgi:alkylated DNA repair dioxygenase AlkB